MRLASSSRCRCKAELLERSCACGFRSRGRTLKIIGIKTQSAQRQNRLIFAFEHACGQIARIGKLICDFREFAQRQIHFAAHFERRIVANLGGNVAQSPGVHRNVFTKSPVTPRGTKVQLPILIQQTASQAIDLGRGDKPVCAVRGPLAHFAFTQTLVTFTRDFTANPLEPPVKLVRCVAFLKRQHLPSVLNFFADCAILQRCADFAQRSVIGIQRPQLRFHVIKFRIADQRFSVVVTQLVKTYPIRELRNRQILRINIVMRLNLLCARFCCTILICPQRTQSLVATPTYC